MSIKLKKLQSLYKNFDKELSKNYKKAKTFSDKALNISIQIADEIESIFVSRNKKNTKHEDEKFEIISRLQQINKIE
jgi:hypothetical protein